MVRIRKTKSSSGTVRFYCGKQLISEEKYEALCVNAKRRPKMRCRAITNENAQCKNLAAHRFAHWCKIHEKLKCDKSPSGFSDSLEDTTEKTCDEKQQRYAISSSNEQCHMHESNSSQSDVECDVE